MNSKTGLSGSKGGQKTSVTKIINSDDLFDCLWNVSTFFLIVGVMNTSLTNITFGLSGSRVAEETETEILLFEKLKTTQNILMFKSKLYTLKYVFDPQKG